MTWLLITLLAVVGLQTLAIVDLFWRLVRLQRRHTALGLETTRMLALHQDYSASFDARLRGLGSRTAGDYPIPTSEELTEARWMR